jgi:hypothetical protein
MSEFSANGRILISVNAEIYGNWAVSESIENDETRDCFVITHIETGKRLPKPFVYGDIGTARRLAKLANQKFPSFTATKEEIAVLRECCLKFHMGQPQLWMPDKEGEPALPPEGGKSK